MKSLRSVYNELLTESSSVPYLHSLEDLAIYWITTSIQKHNPDLVDEAIKYYESIIQRNKSKGVVTTIHIADAAGDAIESITGKPTASSEFQEDRLIPAQGKLWYSNTYPGLKKAIERFDDSFTKTNILTEFVYSAPTFPYDMHFEVNMSFTNKDTKRVVELIFTADPPINLIGHMDSELAAWWGKRWESAASIKTIDQMIHAIGEEVNKQIGPKKVLK